MTPTYSMKDRSDTTIYYTDGKLGEWTAEDLDFLPEKETAVLEGWIARDKGGMLRLHYTEPKRTDSGYWQGAFKSSYLPTSLFPSVTWKDEPKKVKLTIEEIEE